MCSPCHFFCMAIRSVVSIYFSKGLRMCGTLARPSLAVFVCLFVCLSVFFSFLFFFRVYCRSSGRYGRQTVTRFISQHLPILRTASVIGLASGRYA